MALQQVSSAALLLRGASIDFDSSREILSSKITSVFEGKVSNHSLESADFSNLFKSPVSFVLGGMWLVLWSSSLFVFAKSCAQLHSACRIGECTQKSLIGLADAVKQVSTKAFAFVGLSASVGDWANRAKIVSLGAFAPLVRSVSITCSFFTSGVGSVDGVWELGNLFSKSLAGLSQQEVQKHFEAQNLCLLNLASHVTMFAYAAFGISSLAVASAVMPLLLSSSCVFGVSAMVYRWYVNGYLDNLINPVKEAIDRARGQIAFA